jgi:hypothetical protein
VRLVKALISVTTKYVKAFNVCAFAEVDNVGNLGFQLVEAKEDPVLYFWLKF